MINIISKFIAYGELGLPAVLVRQLSIAIGEDAKEKKERIRDLVFTCYWVLTLLGLAILWILYLLGLPPRGTLGLSLIILLTATVLTERFVSYLLTNLKAERRFDVIGKRQIFAAVLGVVLVVPLTIWLGVEGALIASILASVIQGAWLARAMKMAYRLYFNLRMALSFLRLGFVLSLYRFEYHMVWTFQIMILVAMTDIRNVGLYSLALGAFTVMQIVPNAVARVLYPTIMVEKGKSDAKNTEYLRKYTGSMFTIYLLASAVAAGGVFFLFDFFVHNVLVEFGESVSLLKWIVVGFVLWRAALFAHTILDAQGRFATLVIWNLLYNISALALTWLFIDLYGLVGVAMASFVANVVFGLVTLNLAMSRVHNSWLTSLQLALRHTAAWGLTVGAFMGLAQLPDLFQRGQEVTAASVGVGIGTLFIQGV
ncbi:MAG: hypothetical protein V3U90_03265, partial [Dehalococcoidia bacterium]